MRDAWCVVRDEINGAGVLMAGMVFGLLGVV
jgi:hypothetical protein